MFEPTENELKILDMLGHTLKEMGHLEKPVLWRADDDDKFEQTRVIDADIITVGKLLLPKLKPTKAALTAIRVADGEITTARSTEKAMGSLDKALVALGAEPEKAKAVTVARPTPCCPNCIDGPLTPATEVLFSFLTDEERERWSDDHAVVAEGNLTGHRYLLMHRHSEKARRIGWICYDLDDRSHLHFYDWSVPPEEEILAAKLILEHHEDWLRNEATCFHATDVRFKNPFGDINDGVAESGVLKGFGMAFRGLAGA